jgi:hypothetical protein
MFMTRNIIGTVTVMAVLAASAASCRSGTDSPRSATGGWRRVDVPTAVYSTDESRASDLFDVAAISPTDIWTVGSQPGPDDVPLAMHWDGTRWTAFQPPAPRQHTPGEPLDYPASLTVVSASGPRDVWAAGDQGAPYLVHWTGADWSLVPLDAAADLARIWDIAAVSPTDAWVAVQAGRGPDRPVIEHWDGRRWSVIPTPAVPAGLNGSDLRGLAAVSNRDVWAVGDRDGATDSERGCLIEHWDGSRWSLVPCPVPAGATTAWLTAATVFAPNDIWAVGGWTPQQIGTEFVKLQPLVEHWDGVAWRVMPAPDTSPSLPVGTTLQAVAGRSSSDLVAVASDPPTAVLHWNGAQWTSEALTSLVTPGWVPTIDALTTSPDGRIWAVGASVDRGQTSHTPIREGSSELLVLVNAA